MDTQPAQEEDVGVNEQGPEENPSSQSTATATLDRQRVPVSILYKMPHFEMLTK